MLDAICNVPSSISESGTLSIADRHSFTILHACAYTILNKGQTFKNVHVVYFIFFWLCIIFIECLHGVWNSVFVSVKSVCGVSWFVRGWEFPHTGIFCMASALHAYMLGLYSFLIIFIRFRMQF